MNEPELHYRDEQVTYTTTPAPRWQRPAPAPPRRTGLEMLPSLADMQVREDHNTDTATLIERLWVATEQHEAVRPAEALTATELPKISGRSFRWSVVVGAVLLLATALALIQIGTGLPARYMSEAKDSYRTSLGTTRAAVPATRDLLGSLTDPATPLETLSDIAVDLSRLDTAARELFAAASASLPATPPFVSRAELDALTPLRSDMAATAERALAIQRRLGDALTYRLVFARAFQLPDLPTAATTDEASTLGVELGLSLAATLDALAQLPTDPFFDAHRQRTEQVATRYAEWQIEYQTALREADVDGAAALARELEGAVQDVQDHLALPLRTIDAWGTDELGRLEVALDRLIDRLA